MPPRWHPLVRSLLFLVAAIGVQIIAASAAFRVLGGATLSAGSQSLLVFALAALLLVPVTLFFRRTLDRSGGFSSIGIRPPVGGAPAAVRQAVLVPLVVSALLAVWLALLAETPGVAVRFFGRSGELTGASGLLGFAGLLAGFLVQGGVEEWVFRGYIYHALRERWPRSAAVLVSSLVFAAMHGGNPGVSAAALVNLLLAGAIFALLVERSGSLWSAVVAHGVWNFSVSCVLSLPVSGVNLPHLVVLSVRGPALLTGGGFGPEGSLLLTFLAVPLTAILAAGSRRPLEENAVSTREDVFPPPPLETGGGPALAKPPETALQDQETEEGV